MPQREFTFVDANLGDVTFNAKRIAEIMAAGEMFYVNETTGDDANDGGSAAPFKTLDAGLAAATADNGDIVFLMGTAHRTATLNWNKSGVSLIGLKPASGNDRSRISAQGATPFSPLVNVSVQGCLFANVEAYHGGATGATGSQVCWLEAGGRNHYQACQFRGGGDTTTAALAGMRSMVVNGLNGENLFEACSFGNDATLRATNANASLELTGGCPRNVFRDCIFESMVSAAGMLHILVGSGGIDRYAFFDRPVFLNAQFGGPGSTALTACISCHASAGGAVVLRDPISVGAGKLSAAGPVFVVGASPTGATDGLAVLAS